MNPSSRRSSAAPKVTLEKQSYKDMALVKTNFILMAIAGLMIIVGFLLMLGPSTTTDTFNPDIFSTRRVVIGPTIAFIGFIFMGVGILWTPKKGQNDK